MFAKVDEKMVTKAIVGEFMEWFEDSITSDVIIVGGGPSGLLAGRDIAAQGFKTLIIESNNYLGGGFWIGGYLMNTLTFREPSQKILEELGIPFRKSSEGLVTCLGPQACSKLIAAACDAGVRILNMTKVDDVVYRRDRVEGAVINWTPVGHLPRAITCVDPVALEARVVIDATGHDACVVRTLERRGLIAIKDFGPMDIQGSEDRLVEKTGVVHPGLIVAGMAVSTVFGIPRMGPTFGGMLYSGKKAAVEAIKALSTDTNQESPVAATASV